jgi:hypothetical protein
MSAADIMDRKMSPEELAERLEAARMRRGEAILSGQSPAAADKEIAALQRELDQAADVAVAEAHRSAEARRAQALRTRDEQRQALANAFIRYGTVVGQAQAAADDLIAQLLDLRALAATILRTSTVLGHPAGAFQQNALTTRLSHYIARHLAKIGTPSSLGILSWNSVLDMPANWQQAEVVAVRDAIERAVTGVTPQPPITPAPAEDTAWLSSADDGEIDEWN